MNPHRLSFTSFTLPRRALIASSALLLQPAHAHCLLLLAHQHIYIIAPIHHRLSKAEVHDSVYYSSSVLCSPHCSLRWCCSQTPVLR